MNCTGKDKHKCEYTDKKQGKIRFGENDSPVPADMSSAGYCV